MVVEVPDIPDEAFQHVIQRIVGLVCVTDGAPPDDRHESAANFFAGLGLDDQRAEVLAAVAQGYLQGIEPSDVPTDEVSQTVIGMMLGLLLAQGSGWEAPIPQS